MNLEFESGTLQATELKKRKKINNEKELREQLEKLQGASAVHFHDFNAEVLRCLTIPNTYGSSNVREEWKLAIGLADQERSNTYIDCWRLMASSKALLVLGVFMLLMTSFVAGDVADTIRDKPRYINYGGLGCDPKKNPRCRLNPNPTPSGRGCKAEHRCREG
ncbi:hypothetical protein NC651_036669 [Populus alba x Populus x berolinensis]|nr:hypothetical protein NC651_036669 [Populus alba x Populus x berolinensis]